MSGAWYFLGGMLFMACIWMACALADEDVDDYLGEVDEAHPHDEPYTIRPVLRFKDADDDDQPWDPRPRQ